MDKTAPLFSRFARLTLAFFAACLLAVPSGLARKPEPAALPKAPPQPVAPSVQVKRGESVEIPLKIYGTRSQSLDFLIRVPPQTGKLSEIKRTGQESGTITYTPVKDLMIKRDKFLYAVRSSEGVSAAVEVAITILDADPDFFAPETTDFGRLLAGERAVQTVEIVNRGGGIAEGEMEIEPPWQIEGPARYRLAAGTTSRIKLVFASKAAGAARGLLRYGPGTNRTTALVAEVLPPLSILPAQLVFKQRDAKTSLRTAEIEIINNTATVQTATPGTDKRFAFSQAGAIEPFSRQIIQVETTGANVAAFDCSIQFSTNSGELTIQAHGDAVPPILQLTREQIDFGKIAFGAIGREKLGIENRGGKSTTVLIEIAAPYFLAQNSLTLTPGEQKELLIGLRTASPGVHSAVLSLRSNASANLQIPVEARVLPAVGVSTPAEPRSRPVAQIRAVSSRLPEPIAPQPDRSIPIQLAQIVELTPTTAVFDWVEPNPGAVRSKLETRQLSMAGDQLKVEWKEVTTFAAEFKNGRMKGTLTGLDPATLYFIRISAVKADHSVELRCETQLKTPPKEALVRVTPLRVLGALFVITLGGALWQRLASRRAGR